LDLRVFSIKGNRDFPGIEAMRRKNDHPQLLKRSSSYYGIRRIELMVAVVLTKVN